MKKILALICFFICITSVVHGAKLPAPKQYLITQFGAIGDSTTINTKAIQDCIDKCSSDGGGIVIIPKGVFISGAIFLKNKVNLLVERGGKLKGSINPDDYPKINTRWEGEERLWTAALINAETLKNISITGEGIIDGSGDLWRIKKEKMGRPRLIGIQNCNNVVIKGLHLHNQASWGLFILYSTNVEIKGLNITADHDIPSSDGIDIDSSSKIHISETFIDVNDDCISIKSGKDQDGLRVNRPSENILIEKCHFAYGHGGVAMGSETSGGIKNVEIRDCIIDSQNWAPIRFKSQPSRGGVVEKITYRNITLNNTKKAFEFNMEWRMVDPKPAAEKLPIVRNIKIINVSGTADTVGDMNGLKDSPITGVKFINCNITAKKGFTLRYVNNIDLSGLTITGVIGEAIIKKE
jgi:exo-poly-alpha-galacturonosidase